MTSGQLVGAGSATVLQVLAYLDTEFNDLATGVGDGTYAIWLGSGFSIDKLDGLRRVIERALVAMHDRADPSDPSCPYTRALRQSVRLARLPSAQAAEIDTASPPDTWAHRDALIAAIAGNYSKFLDIRIGSNPPDHVLWDLIDVRATYADPNVTPDAQHAALALLAVEGHAPEIISANWDGLLEGAFTALGRNEPSDLKICVRAEDLDGPTARARLIKFHGCAVRAAKDPDAYRDLLIHTDTQISSYKENTAFSGIRNQIVALATSRPTLMIGLSAQDADIKAIFSEAAHAHPRDPDTNPHAVVFAENDLGGDQGTILRATYGKSFDNDPTRIEDTAVVHTYARPLLIALALHVLAAKLSAIAQLAHSNLPTSESERLLEGIRALRDATARHAELDPIAFVSALAKTVTATMAVARCGRVATGAAARYTPIAARPIHMLRDDEEIASNGMPEAATAIALLGHGILSDSWSLDPQADGEIRLSTDSKTHRVFVTSSDRAAVELINSGKIDTRSADAILVHAFGAPFRARRRPRMPPGRTGTPVLREVHMRDIMLSAATAADVNGRFREQAGL